MAALLITVMFISALIMISNRKRFFNFIKFRSMISELPSAFETAFPLIGHAYLFVGDPAEFFHYISNMASLMIERTKLKLVTLWLGPVPLVVMVHPDAIETILRSSKHMTKSFVYNFLHPWLGTGLLTSAGEKWKQRRRLITPSFHFSILEDFLQVMNEQAGIMVNDISKKTELGNKVDVGKSITMCALDIICETAMGQSVNAQADSDSKYIKALYRISDLIQLRQKTPFMWWDFAFNKMRAGIEQKATLRTLHDFTRSVIEQRIASKSESKNLPKRMAFLDMLINAVTDDGKSLSLADIQEEVDTFMFEGHDTTAAAMTWAIYLIGRHPEVQRRIHDELDDVFGNDSNRAASMDDLRNLPYLEQVIKESLRLFPSVPLIARVTTDDCQVDDFAIPKGTQVAIFVYNLHHSPEVWNDPETFDPDRFNKENSIGRHPYAHIPFSAGPRNCIGQRFALLEEKVIISQLMRNFNVTSHDKREDIKMVGDLILRPAAPLNITLTKRS